MFKLRIPVPLFYALGKSKLINEALICFDAGSASTLLEADMTFLTLLLSSQNLDLVKLEL
jgi:hypothetical protein